MTWVEKRSRACQQYQVNDVWYKDHPLAQSPLNLGDCSVRNIFENGWQTSDIWRHIHHAEQKINRTLLSPWVSFLFLIPAVRHWRYVRLCIRVSLTMNWFIHTPTPIHDISRSNAKCCSDEIAINHDKQVVDAILTLPCKGSFTIAFMLRLHGCVDLACLRKRSEHCSILRAGLRNHARAG
jgi:hypothetical protein